MGETLYQRLIADAGVLGASVVWLREYAGDKPLLAFLYERGCVETIRTPSPDGAFEHVTLERAL